jgi:hypothetical protein
MRKRKPRKKREYTEATQEIPPFLEVGIAYPIDFHPK